VLLLSAAEGNARDAPLPKLDIGFSLLKERAPRVREHCEVVLGDTTRS
jgi:hypothetical protein